MSDQEDNDKIIVDIEDEDEEVLLFYIILQEQKDLDIGELTKNLENTNPIVERNQNKIVNSFFL